jgi:DNA-binding transcriptional regulator PaaX
MSVESTRQTLFGIFLVAGRPLTAAQVIALATPLGLSASNVKSHLTRLVADGALTREGPVRAARYAPSEHQARLAEGIRLRLDTRTPPEWDGDWLSLLAEPPRLRAAREQWRAWLWFDGFRPVTPGAHVRPAWPLPWAVERAQAHVAMSNGFCVRGALVGTLNLDAVQSWYGVAALHAKARALAQRLQQHGTRIRDPHDAFAWRIRLGGDVAQLAAQDPRLPAALWGRYTGMSELARAHAAIERELDARSAAFVAEVLQG